jgi:hypothetical protein
MVGIGIRGRGEGELPMLEHVAGVASGEVACLRSSESAKTRFSRKSEGFFLKFRIFYHKSEELSLQ